MMTYENQSQVLKNTLVEIRNVCPDVKAAFIFDKEATLIAGDDEAKESTLKKVVGSLEGILKKADTIGGLNSLRVEGSKGNVHVIPANELYLTMVSSKNADTKYLETVGRVLIPTVMKLLDGFDPTPLRQLPQSHDLFKPQEEEMPRESKERLEEENEEEEDVAKIEEEPDELTPEIELPSNQLIVETFSGFLVRSDTVQISEDVMAQWEELLDGKAIARVEVEAFNGKSSECKVKTVDNAKLENKAIIKIPEKLCQELDIDKGELVRVKPVLT
jgi:predicted regulator of Ras-like GTPase activity (Roadblock/LC7/MglB family)